MKLSTNYINSYHTQRYFEFVYMLMTYWPRKFAHARTDLQTRLFFIPKLRLTLFSADVRRKKYLADIQQRLQIKNLCHWICSKKQVENIGNAVLNILQFQQTGCFHAVGSTIVACCQKDFSNIWKKLLKNICHMPWQGFCSVTLKNIAVQSNDMMFPVPDYRDANRNIWASNMTQTARMSAKNCLTVTKPALYMSCSAVFDRVLTSGNL